MGAGAPHAYTVVGLLGGLPEGWYRWAWSRNGHGGCWSLLDESGVHDETGSVAVASPSMPLVVWRLDVQLS